MMPSRSRPGAVRRSWAALVTLVLAVPLAALMALAAATPAAAASLTRVTNFGNNPSGLNMYVYVPNNVAPRPALLVAVHYCTGSASAFFNGGAHDYVTAADKYGYVIVFPEATRSGQCFDVYSQQALTRGGGSDPVGIKSMVDYAESHYNIDTSRVYLTGASSGAMMTNVLAAEYPDVFKAASAFMGVPATCFATTGGSTWNSDCSGGNITKTAQQWGDAARAMYPGYSGSYPRMQLWHGTTDTTLNYHNFGEEIKQWTNLKGVSQTPALTDSPQSGWTRTRYGSAAAQPPVEGISVAGVGHSLPMSGMVQYAIDFLGLSSTTPSPTTPNPTTPNPTTPNPTTPNPTTPNPTTPNPTTPNPTTPNPNPGSGCTATYSIQNSWQGGFVGMVTVKAGSAAITGWSVALSVPSGTAITNTWNGTLSGSTVTNAVYNGSLPAGGSATFGMQGTGAGQLAVTACAAS